MERTPEPELMEGPEQAQAYAGADFSEAHENIVMEFCARFPGVEVTGEVLDLGCGPGDITFRFASKFPRAMFFGVDGSGEMIRLAEERKGREQVLSRRITFIRGSIPGASIPNLGYEAIISNSLLHHLRRPEVLWETVVEYARPGTIIYIADLLRPESTGEARRLVEEYAATEPEILKRDFYNSLLSAFEPAEVEAQLTGAGLAELSVRVITDRHFIVYGVKGGSSPPR